MPPTPPSSLLRGVRAPAWVPASARAREAGVLASARARGRVSGAVRGMALMLRRGSTHSEAMRL